MPKKCPFPNSIIQITKDNVAGLVFSLRLNPTVGFKVEAFGAYPFRFRILILGTPENQLIAQRLIHSKFVEMGGDPKGIDFYQNLRHSK